MATQNGPTVQHPEPIGLDREYTFGDLYTAVVNARKAGVPDDAVPTIVKPGRGGKTSVLLSSWPYAPLPFTEPAKIAEKAKA
jgi:hypothetical protein